MFSRVHAVICLVLAMPASATNLTQITDDPTYCMHPAWSPNGN